MSLALAPCSLVLHPADLLGQVGAQLFNSVEFAGQLGEVLVDLGQRPLGNGLHGDGHLRLATGEAAGNQRGGEGLALPGGEPGDGVVDAIDQIAGADGVGQPLGGGLVECLAVDGGGQIDADQIAIGGSPLDHGGGGEPLAQRLDLLVDVGIGDLDVVDGDRDRRKVGQLELRTDVDLGGERQRVAVIDPGHLDLRLAEGVQRGLGHRLAVLGGHRLVDHLGENGAATEPGVENARRHLARPEARDANLATEDAVGLVEVWFELVERNLDGELHPGRVQVLDGALHVRYSSGLSAGGPG